MSLHKLVADELWSCLCPAFDARLLRTNVRRPVQAFNAVSRRAYTPRRPLPYKKLESDYGSEETTARLESRNRHLKLRQILIEDEGDLDASTHNSVNTINRAAVAVNRHTSFPSNKHHIYTLLRRAAARGLIENVDELVDVLVKRRHEAPNTKLYAALILVNVDRERGSAGRVRALLKEMEIEGIVPDDAVYNSALKVR